MISIPYHCSLSDIFLQFKPKGSSHSIPSLHSLGLIGILRTVYFFSSTKRYTFCGRNAHTTTEKLSLYPSELDTLILIFFRCCYLCLISKFSSQSLFLFLFSAVLAKPSSSFFFLSALVELPQYIFTLLSLALISRPFLFGVPDRTEASTFADWFHAIRYCFPN